MTPPRVRATDRDHGEAQQAEGKHDANEEDDERTPREAASAHPVAGEKPGDHEGVQTNTRWLEARGHDRRAERDAPVESLAGPAAALLPALKATRARIPLDTPIPPLVSHLGPEGARGGP